MTSFQLCNKFTFDCLTSQTIHRSNYCCNVRFQIIKYLLGRGWIAFKNEQVFIRNLSDNYLQSILDMWCAALNVGSKQSIAWNDI
jgi:hypothetical protein